jgi:subtilisin family serine protease
MHAEALSPHLPAAYPSVIGVAASNTSRERSCFSNWADVSAPGGEGGLGEVPDLSTDELFDTIPSSCAPVSNECKGNCPNALISMSTSSPTGYAYWTGTSFSTPLVSGLAALIFDAGVSENLCGTDWVSPNAVFEAIRCGAPTPDGVINVPATLFRCLP